MKKTCIFKCWAQGEWWYVYETSMSILRANYRVYRGRKWYEHVVFEKQQYAIAAVVNAVTVGMEGCNFKVEERQ